MSKTEVKRRYTVNRNDGRLERRCSNKEKTPERTATTKLRAAEANSAR